MIKLNDLSVIVTYRCPMRCDMCNIWKHPSNPAEEITASDLRILPDLKFINITGGEPFVREDLAEIVEECFRHTQRIVISTSGWFPERVKELCRAFPKTGIRVSLEGLEKTNDELRGRDGDFRRGMTLIKELKEMGLTDIGMAMTVGDRNAADLIPLYEMAKREGLEFATAAVHNSEYFHKHDNRIVEPAAVCGALLELAGRQLRERNPKSWFRAYFNMGLAGYAAGAARLLPCRAGSINAFIDPKGDVFACNGTECSSWHLSMGNIRHASAWNDIWESETARSVREHVATCSKNCWMVGTVAPVMKSNISTPAAWVATNKLRALIGRPVSPAASIKDYAPIKECLTRRK